HLLGADGSSEAGSLNATNGVLSGTNSHYGVDLTLRIDRICEVYEGGSRLCSPQGDTYSQHLGVAASANIDGFNFGPDPVTNLGTFTWTGWPTGSYDSVTYTCGDGVQYPMPATGSTASCVVPDGVQPVLRISVGANGQTYTRDYGPTG
ncbi:hypothetical protein, partial [Kitasatospora herbaricolor]|uniref:hypothetical protein n=1 Tax=Kitasatospora herbaricolor TaxID=68217 RepID=UPI0036DEB92B